MEEDPMSGKMAEARRSTFGDVWPHEAKKGWKCKVNKMVAAGWCYNPLPGADDCTTCFYCGVTLDGWEPKDDPWKEHQKRAPDCDFFRLLEESAKSRGPTTKGRKRAGSRTSKVSRASTQSIITVASELPSFTSVNELDMPAEVDDTVLTTATTASTTKGKGRARSGKASTAKPRAPQKKKKIAEMEDSVASTGEGAASESEPVPAVPTQPVLKRGRAASRTVKQALAREEDISRVESVQADRESPAQPIDKSASYPKRGKKRSSDGKEKVDDLSLEAEFQSQAVEGPLKPANKAGTSKKPTGKAKEPQIAVLEDTEHGLEKAQIAQNDTNRTEAQDDNEPPSINQDQAEQISEMVAARGNLREVQQPFHTSAPYPTQPTSEVVDSRLASPQSKRSTPEKTVRSMPGAFASPSQSSDAENQPPSSTNPSLRAQFEEIQKQEQQRATAQTPTASPSKQRNRPIAGGLTSTQPWTEADLDTLLLLPGTPLDEEVPFKDRLENLTSPEKQMTVEEWIEWNATLAERKLKGQCERLVGVFEKEGMRAMQTLEGIGCA